jgi:hypothetical protein
VAPVFQPVPDWISAENQGANVAVADLNNDGRPELIVLRVDHPTRGPNRGFYRVGRSLDAPGNITGGWAPWIEVPDWASAENQGAGVAVADLDGDGIAELIVFQVQHRVPGPNRGLFRIGRKLDAQGNVTGGWSNWQEVPGWISWRDQGAAIAVADLDGDAQPELIIMHIDDFHGDNPGRPNKGFYRVGRGLRADGQVNAWGGWVEIDWFSWFNQGAGLAVADLDGNGRPELIVFQIDNPPGENAGFYRVGWNLDQQGKIQDGWSPWVQIDGWRSFEDQGGGIALASFVPGARPKAVVFHVDNPPGLNAGLYAVVDLKLDLDEAAQKGVWRLLPYFSEVLPVHAALLHTGKVLFFAGSGNNAFRFESPQFGNEAQKVYTSVVWDFVKNTFDHPPTLRQPDGRPVDFFCCGHCFLPNGGILAAGGTDQYDNRIENGHMVATGKGFLGRRDAATFDTKSEHWVAVAKMAHGRWYPTLVMLADGTALATAGLDEFGSANNRDANNTTLEQNSDPGHGTWKKARDFKLPLYPHLFLLRDGRLIYTGGKMDTLGDSQPLLFDPLTPTASRLVDGLQDPGKCNQGASLILPPAQNQQIMILGGGPEDQDGQPRQPATNRVNIVDLSAPNPRYEATGALKLERMHVNAVLLPDRTVLATGGGVTREASVTGNVDPQQFRERFEAELYDLTSKQWGLTAKATVARLYHSVALLLPDGRVVTAGGNPDKGSQVPWLPPDPFEEMRLEIYSPPYLFKGPRPVIQDAPQEVAYGATITIQTTRASQIRWVNLIRPGLTTHSFNGEQRLVDVPFSVNAGSLKATVTGERNLAPPGWYMLFLTDNAGVPSVGRWVHLS